MTDHEFENPYLNNQENTDDMAFNPAEEDAPVFNENSEIEADSENLNDVTEDIPVKASFADSEDMPSESCSEQPGSGFGYAEPIRYPEPQPSYQPQPQFYPQSQPEPQSPYTYEWYGGNPRASYPQASQPSQPSQPPQPSKPQKPKAGVSKGMFFGGIAICLCLSFLFGFAGTWAYNKFGKSIKTTNTNGLTINQVQPQNGAEGYVEGGLSTVEIVNKAADSVVEITTETVKTGVFAQQYIDSGAGSGVIIDEKGIIVTNHHVIDGATKISVSLRDGTSYDATLLGSDSELDVALIEITPNKALTAATFGDSSTLMVGQRTVAIGNPLGQLGGSVTEGIISALNRDVVIDGQTMSLLQTDTAINPGNSGGGLFDANGNLIGIVNAKSSGSEIEGLGFAIPINDVIDVIGDLAEYGYVRGRVDLGITFIDVESQQVAWMYGLSETGCYIYSVEDNRNADLAGLVSGDRVVSVNSEEVKTSDDIEAIITNCTVGEEVTFEVESTSGKTRKVFFELEEYVPESKNKNFFDNNGGSLNDYSYWWSIYN